MKRAGLVIVILILSLVLVSGCTSSKAQASEEQAILETMTKTSDITSSPTSTQSKDYSSSSKSTIQDFSAGDFILNEFDQDDVKLVSKVTDSKYGLYSLYFDEYEDAYVVRDSESYSLKSSVNDKYQLLGNIGSMFVAVKTQTTRKIVKFLIVKSDSEMITDPQPLCDCEANYLSCYDFSDWADAQKCYVYCRSLGNEDVHDLDRDNDNCACEYNDGCPCS